MIRRCAHCGAALVDEDDWYEEKPIPSAFQVEMDRMGIVYEVYPIEMDPATPDHDWLGLNRYIWEALRQTYNPHGGDDELTARLARRTPLAGHFAVFAESENEAIAIAQRRRIEIIKARRWREHMLRDKYGYAFQVWDREHQA